MNAPELLRAGGWRQGHGDNGQPYWEHAERHGFVRWATEAALTDELARVSADRLREAHGFAKREEALQRQVADLQRIEELARREPNYQTALEAWSAEISNRQRAEAGCAELRANWDACHHQHRAAEDQLARALELLREAAPALLEGAKELRKVIERPAPAEPHWLTKDFNALYRAARELLRAIDGHWLDGRAEAARIGLSAQLTRLQPAFDETEAARAELAGSAP